ncbi:MAG: lysophospholipid acyltransferase family protein [Desulfobacterales bacterium]|jgi:lysophospholipid acyltransferase (LPLAT)-like uncharacterized protein|nr:lysophospholipid acyltransferase family protein [Desulfobacterales bacterium]
MSLFTDNTPEICWRLVGLLGKWAIDLLAGSLRVEVIGHEKVRPIMETRRFILSFWHSRILVISFMHKGWNSVVMASRSADGEIIARVIERQGHAVVRGSTGKGGLRALARQIKLLNEKDRPGGMIPDGPQGPRHRVQPGIIALAQKTGYPIIPVSCSARKLKAFHSWDRFIVPYPFTRCRLVYGKPMVVPGKASARTLEACRLQLETEMRRITFTHDRHYGHELL